MAPSGAPRSAQIKARAASDSSPILVCGSLSSRLGIARCLPGRARVRILPIPPRSPPCLKRCSRASDSADERTSRFSAGAGLWMRYVTWRYESVRLATRPVGLGVDVTGAGERLGFFGHSLRLIKAPQRVERLNERAGDVAKVSPLTR